jgi:thiol-disulfide isomerase/thioredoxin
MSHGDQSVPPATVGRPRIAPLLLAGAAVVVLGAGLAFMISSSQQAGAGQGGSAWESGGDIQLISAAGESVDVTRHLAPGKYTVIDFFADWCANCKEVTPVLEELTRRRSDFALRKVNVVNWDTPVAAQYKVSYLPYLQMYGPGGELLADGADQVLAELKRRFPPPAG